MLRAPTRPPRTIGKYLVFDELASGGMATIYLGRHVDATPPVRCVAIKRMHPQFSRDPEFVAMFLDEARLAARVRHPNVVQTIDVERVGGEIVHVMPYVHGESLSHLMRGAKARGERVPLAIASAIMFDALEGLHAAHEATGDDGTPLDIVHRDVSPQNILVGTDGVARVLDFGVAKAAGRLHSTRGSEVKGKFAYMSPEQVQRTTVDRRTDVWAAAVVLWEIVTGERLFAADTPAGSVQMILETAPRRPTDVRPELPADLDAIVSQGLEKDKTQRFASARALGSALASAVPPASREEVGAWVERLAAQELFERATRVRVIEHAGDRGGSGGANEETSRGSIEPTAPGRGRAGRPGAPTTKARADDTDVALAAIPRSRPVVALLAVGLFVLAASLGVFALVRARSTTSYGSSSATSTSTNAIASSSPSTSTAVTIAATPTTAMTAAASGSSASPGVRPSATTRPSALAHPPLPPRPNCNPPFRYDKDGTKIPKPECL